MQDWKKEVSRQKPEPLELVATGTYIERKNIKEVEHEKTEWQDAYTDYECVSREISVSEYNMLKSIQEIDSQKAVDAYTLQLMKEGVI